MNKLVKEVGGALLATVVIPISVQLLQQLAEHWQERLTKKNRIVIKLNVPS